MGLKLTFRRRRRCRRPRRTSCARAGRRRLADAAGGARGRAHADPALPGPVRERVLAAVGPDNVLEDRETRVQHSAGKGYADLVRVHSSDASAAPDTVVQPGSADEVEAVLRACADAGVAVVPFGGGTSVVEGVEPPGTVIRRLCRLTSAAWTGSSTSTAGRSPPRSSRPVRAGRQRLAEGLTLGHFPQSFEFSTVGGWVATRRPARRPPAGRIDELVEGVTCVAPAGRVEAVPSPLPPPGPACASCWWARGSAEGDLLRDPSGAPRAGRTPLRGLVVQVVRRGDRGPPVMEQAEAPPDIARLSDEEETGSRSPWARRAAPSSASARLPPPARARGGCLAIAGYEGDDDHVARRRERTTALLRAGGGAAARAKARGVMGRGRYAALPARRAIEPRRPRRDARTATSWSGLGALYRGVAGPCATPSAPAGRRRSSCATSPTSTRRAHRSTSPSSPASRRGLEQWHAAKKAASDAIVANGGTITHHHAIGRDHLPWMRHEVGRPASSSSAPRRSGSVRRDHEPGKLLP